MNPKDYTYILPEESIAKFPLKDRSAAKLLVYREGKVTHRQFDALPALLPEKPLIFFNNTRVIPARLHFQRATGAHIEIFLLEPLAPANNVEEAMLATGTATWQCMIGNLKKWKAGEVLSRKISIESTDIQVNAILVEKTKQTVQLSWQPTSLPFSELVEALGAVPLPPYIKRELTEEDKPRYQTVYSEKNGAVAAPTAGLHFSEELLQQCIQQDAKLQYLTLHVSAGTFQPMKVDRVTDHDMHQEQILVSRENVQALLEDRPVLAVGTTSLRTLESLYWFGVKLMNAPEKSHVFYIEKLFPYQWSESILPERKKAMAAVDQYMQVNNLTVLQGNTSIFIFPGYTFRMVDMLQTNFHLPGSTLILLVAAFIGEDWKKVYDEALEQHYRFLSYGDTSLLWPQ